MTHQQYGTYSFAAVAPTQTIQYQYKPDAFSSSIIHLTIPVFPDPSPTLAYAYPIIIVKTQKVLLTDPEPQQFQYWAQVWRDDDRCFQIIVDGETIVAYFSLPTIETDTWADDLRSKWAPFMTLTEVPNYLDGVLV